MKIRYARHLFKTKGFIGSFYRLRNILCRFGLNSSKSKRSLDIFLDIMYKFGYTPTICITSILLLNYQKIISKLSKRADIAFHGYVHTNYTNLTPKKITKHLMKSNKLFKKYGLQASGFRFPYLCWNENILNTLKTNNFLWSSNHVVYWDIFDRDNFSKQRWKNFQKVLNNLYIHKNSKFSPSLPQKKNGFVEIPVSIPDDEIIIDRLGIIDQDQIAQIWWKIFEETYRRGELFTLQLHHERVPFFGNALRSFLTKVKSLNSKVWVASLREIAEWWNEKNAFNLRINSQKNGYYHIETECSDRATILINKANIKNSFKSIFDNYNIINNNKYFKIKLNKKPFIGLAENTPQELIDFLNEEGYVTEIISHNNNYALYLGNYNNFNVDYKKNLKKIIEANSTNLIRFWRWPNKAQSALSISLDIDSITLFDFLKRPFYF